MLTLTASVWEPAYSLHGWLVPTSSLFPSLWLTSFTSVCFGQLPHFALTVWFSKNKEEMGKEICVQHGYREMCLEVRVFGAKWWLPGGQPVLLSWGRGQMERTSALMGHLQRWCLKGRHRKNPRSLGMGTSECASVPLQKLPCVHLTWVRSAGLDPDPSSALFVICNDFGPCYPPAAPPRKGVTAFLRG